METPNKKKLKKGFTLVELIIVISILGILATIAFVSFQGYSKDARDGNRLSTLTSIDKGLNLIQVQSGKFPNPDGIFKTGSLLLGGTEIVYSYMGVIDEDLGRMMKLNSTPSDPVTGNKYVYAVNSTQSRYQLGGVLESLQAQERNKFIKNAYANVGSQAKVFGNHEINVRYEYENTSGESKVVLMTIPSMLLTNDSGNRLNSSGSYFIVNGGRNLPYVLREGGVLSYQGGTEIMRYLRGNVEAEMLEVDVTGILEASDEGVRSGLIKTVFGTGGNVSTAGLGGVITSRQALASLGAVQTEETWLDESVIVERIEAVLAGKKVSNKGGSSTIKGIVLYEDGRRWSDGTYAKNCNEYRNPSGNYTYAGNSLGDGVYWIQPNSNPAFKVYCDMTTDGGGWTLVTSIEKIQTGNINSFKHFNKTTAVAYGAINQAAQEIGDDYFVIGSRIAGDRKSVYFELDLGFIFDELKGGWKGGDYNLSTNFTKSAALHHDDNNSHGSFINPINWPSTYIVGSNSTHGYLLFGTIGNNNNFIKMSNQWGVNWNQSNERILTIPKTSTPSSHTIRWQVGDQFDNEWVEFKDIELWVK